MRSSTATILLGLLTLSACTHVAVYVEHDPTASFADLTTYDWVTAPPAATDAPVADDQILDNRVRSIVETELAADGFARRTDGTADFLVGYSAAEDSSLQAVTIDRYHGYIQSTYLTRAGTTRGLSVPAG